jgi:cell wall-associated NlpC family hydrolase
MRRVLVLACLLFSFVALGVSSAGAAPRSWATPQMEAVVDAGLMAPSIAEFRPDDLLTAGELAIVLSTLGMPVVSVTDVDRPVTLRELDAQLVTAIGFREYARNLRLDALAGGLTPKQWLGTETVARLLGLRVNHVKTQEQLELQLGQPATRAEAAYSIARLLTISEFELEQARTQLETFTFPALDAWQQAVLARALRFVGSPYVWAGTSERPQVLLGRKQPGGFDCSGFVWRVYKLQPFAGAEALGAVLKGRTTFDMSGEVPRSARIPWLSLQAGDLVFFGSRGKASKPSEVNHMGIYVGNGWMAHSSDRGTTLTPMTGWYETRFAWGRRPLAEAGLS